MKICLIKNKNRNSSISIGASVIIDELRNNFIHVDIADYSNANNYDIAMISITATIDIFDIYTNLKKHNFQNRKCKVIVGGFGCQNISILEKYIDFAFFGRADGIIVEVLKGIYNNENNNYPFLYSFEKDKKVEIRQVNILYPNKVRYGKNNSTWQESFIGCKFRCKFCHYSHNRKYINKKDTYINDGLSSGSPELMLKDIINLENKLGRLTTAIDGYSQRLRYKFGKRISWDMIEEALDHLAVFKGNTFVKLYNIHNLPTETEADREEFFDFFKEYVNCSEKNNGLITVSVLNTAFRPSINTPMERHAVKLFPTARYENTLITKGTGFVFKFSNNNQGAYSHLLDLISIRYTEKHFDMIDFICFDKEFNKLNKENRLQVLFNKFNINDFIRSYDKNEPFISDIFI